MQEAKNIEKIEDASLSEMLEQVFTEYRKTLFTAIPAIVQSYDPATKRADLQPTPTREFKDGTTGAMPILPNVPVLIPSGGGFCLDLPIATGDVVLIIFCQRGIKNFKKTFGLEDPSGGVLDINSPVAIAGFGSLSITPSTGLSLQKEDGSVKVEVFDDQVIITAPVLLDVIIADGVGGMSLNADGSVIFANGATITAAGDFVTAGGVSLDTLKADYDAHIHATANVAGGSSTRNSGTPI